MWVLFILQLQDLIKFIGIITSVETVALPSWLVVLLFVKRLKCECNFKKAKQINEDINLTLKPYFIPCNVITSAGPLQVMLL